jgi:hypothetical protein
MGAPPGVGSSTSTPTSANDGKIPLVPAPSGSAAPPPGDSTAQFQQPVTVAAPLDTDEARLRLAQGLKLFSDNHLDSARLALQPLPKEGLAGAIVENIEDREGRFRALQASATLKALAAEGARNHEYSGSDQTKLSEAVSAIESQLISKPGASLSKAIEAAKPGLSADALKAWERFAGEQENRLKELDGLFQEKDRDLLAHGLLNLAERLREQKYFSTSWTLAQFAAEFPDTQPKAAELIQYLEGKRSTTSYVISDMFDHGGSSMAINLLSLFPAVAGARRFSQTARIASKSFFLKAPATLLVGSGIHWSSTKGLMWASGYDGQIMPRSWGEFGAEFASSTAQTGLALLLASRFWKIKPPVAKAAAETEAVAAAATRSRVWTGMAKGGRALWWSTKLGLKVGTVTAGDLGVQWGFHATGFKNMTPQGFPQGFTKTFFPGTYENRQIVISTYEGRRLLEQHLRAFAGAEKSSPSPGLLEPGFNLDIFLTELDPSLDGDRREMARAVFAEASQQKKLGLNIRRWVLSKKKAGEFASANKTLERQGMPVRFDQDGFLCFTDSKTFPCP